MSTVRLERIENLQGTSGFQVEDVLDALAAAEGVTGFKVYETVDDLSSIEDPEDEDVVFVQDTMFQYDEGEDEWVPITPINAKAYGAKGDGVTDDAQAIKDALDAADQFNIFDVYLPQSEFGYLVSHNIISLPANCTLRGRHELHVPDLYTSDQDNWRKGVCLVVESGSGTTNGSLIELRDGTSFTGINIYHRTQVETAPPDEYPPVFWLLPQGANVVNIRDVCMFNPYIGIDASGGHQNLFVVDVVGQPLYKGMIMGEATQIDRLTRVDFGGYWHRSNFFDVWDDPNHVVNWMQSNAIAFEFGRSDDFVMEDCLVYGYQYGVYFTDNDSINAYGKLTDCSFDYVQYGVKSINGGQSNGILVSNCHFIPENRNETHTAAFYHEGNDDAQWAFVNCTSWGEDVQRFSVMIGGFAQFSNCKINSYDTSLGAMTFEQGAKGIITGTKWASLEDDIGNHVFANHSDTSVLVNSCVFDTTNHTGGFQAGTSNGATIQVGEVMGI